MGTRGERMSSRQVEPDVLAPDDAVEQVVALACLAPSVHNTQPWLWRYDGRRLTLQADRRRQLDAEDPLGRNLTISCGAALHHLQFAAEALGWDTEVEVVPITEGSPVLARVVISRGGEQPTRPADLTVLQERCTDRRRFTAWPVPEDRLERLCLVASRWGAEATAVTEDAARFRLELLANQATTAASLEPGRRSEQERWLGRTGPDGIPRDLLPDDPDPAHPRSRFRPAVVEDTRLAVHSGDRVIVLGGTTDDPAAWLRTGQALSALWLEATREGISVVPMSQPIELEDVRRSIADDVLRGAFEPHALLAVGWQALGRRDQPHTPRRPLAEVLWR